MTDTRKMFDDIAPSYDALNHIMSVNVDKSWRSRAIKELTDGGEPRTFLDVACGTGDSTIAIAKAAGPEAKVTGVDISAGMMELVSGKAAKEGVLDRITLRLADGENLPYADGSFQRVFCAFGIRNFTHKDKGLEEFRRVLVPGGKAVILELSVPQAKILRGLYDIYFMHVLPFIGGVISGNKKAYRYLPASVHAFPAPERFCAMMKEAGFENVRYRTMSLGLCRMFIGEK